MDKVIVAFESGKTCTKIKEILERSGTANCILCHSAAEVRRVVCQQHITAVVCGYKFSDASAEELAGDLPDTCAMLLLAPKSLLDMVVSQEVFRLSLPVSKGDLAASVRMLLQVGRRLEHQGRRRSGEEQAVVDRAKALLMERQGMSEAQAHRYLQKRRMDAGERLARTARAVLEEGQAPPRAAPVSDR